MTNEIIEKYLDQQGITSGEWKPFNIGLNNKRVYQIVGHIKIAIKIPKIDCLLIANSRKSLRDWIMVAYTLFPVVEDSAYPSSLRDAFFYKLATENIEASLGKPWSEVRAELEWMEG